MFDFTFCKSGVNLVILINMSNETHEIILNTIIIIKIKC